jgi:hypothetical protein
LIVVTGSRSLCRDASLRHNPLEQLRIQGFESMLAGMAAAGYSLVSEVIPFEMGGRPARGACLRAAAAKSLVARKEEDYDEPTLSVYRACHLLLALV